ncbi:Pycsar system effector family protein [Streptomyces sp. NPDC000877]|uniref:Pycsar system effector family protein n=1 Tax=unclassified Streptomyces TaxID=2593676 RepID=UPI00333295D2
MTAPDGPEVRAGSQLLADLRSEIARADTKATVLVGALGISGGMLAALLANRGWSPARLPVLAALLWWAGATSLVVALFALLLAVLPRYGRSRWTPGRPLTYFGDVHRAAQTGRLSAALAETGRDPARGLLLALAETSGIAARKHFWIRTGLVSFGCAAALLPGSMLLA